MNAETTQILDAFMQRLMDNDMVIVHRSVLGDAPADLAQLQRKTLRNTALTPKQISAAQLWGNISPHQVRALIKEHCGEDEVVKLVKSNRTLTKVIRAGVERVARIRNIVWLD